MTLSKSALFLAASALALPLVACKLDNRPLLARNDGPPPAYGGLPQPGLPTDYGQGQGYAETPSYAALPARYSYEPPARVYPYAERAYALDRTFYDTPPDYAFQYDGVEPWVWETAYDDYEVAYPYEDNYLFYYYQPGYDYPYFVRDAGYGYAYGRDGTLDAVFNAAGVLLAADALAQFSEPAHRYWRQGYDMRQAWNSAPRLAVTQTNWSQRAPLIQQQQTAWVRAGDAQPAWRSWRAQTGDAIVRRYDPVRQTRMAALSSAQAGDFQPGWSRAPRQGFGRGAAPMIDQGGVPVMAGRSGHLQTGRGPDMRPAFAGGPNARTELPPGAARAAEAHGRDAMARGPDARFAQGAATAPERRGREMGWRGADVSRAARQDFARAEAPRSSAPPEARHDFAPREARREMAPAQPRFEGAGQPRGPGGGGGHAQAHIEQAPPQQHFAQAAPAAPPNPGGGGQPHGNGGGQPHPQGNGAGHGPDKDKNKH